MLKRIILFFVSMMLVLSLVACGGSNNSSDTPIDEPTSSEQTPTDEPAPEPEPEPEPTWQVPGDYKSFAYRYEGINYTEDLLGYSTYLTLGADGKSGNISIETDSAEVVSWTESNGNFTIELDDGGVANGSWKDGIIELDLVGDGSVYILLCQEGADISGYDIKDAKK